MSTKSQKDPLDQGDLKNDQVSEYSISPPKFRKAVYLSAIVAAVGGFICGYDTGAITGILAMPLFQENFFTEDTIVYLQGLLFALYLMTASLGAFFSGYFCGKLEKYTLSIFIYSYFRSIQ